MAPSLVIQNGARLTLYWTNSGELAVNTLGALITGSPTFDQPLANTLGTAIKSAFVSRLSTLYSNKTQLVRVGIRDLRSAGQPEYRDSSGASPGTAIDEPLPRQVAINLTLRTRLAGRKFRGRCYLPPPGEAQNDVNGLIVPAFASAAVLFLQDIDGILVGNAMDLAVISQPSERYTIVKTTFHDDGTTTTETLSNIAARDGQINVTTTIESRDSRWETQRRRNNARSAPLALLANGPVASAEV